MQDLIDKYKLVPHPEGGYYAVVYESEQSVKSPVVNKVRKALTHIYFLLLKLIKYNGSEVEEDIIGAGCSDFVSIVIGGMYQAAEPTGGYSLVGCTVAPGFEFEDFSFLRDDLETKEKLLNKFPDYQKFV